MHGIVEVTSFYSECFSSRAYASAMLLTISQPTPWDNQPRSPLRWMWYSKRTLSKEISISEAAMSTAVPKIMYCLLTVWPITPQNAIPGKRLLKF